MAKKTNKETAEKNQSESFDRELSELREALDSNVKELAKMDFEDFKREMLEHFKTINENIFILVDELTREAERIDGCLEVIVNNGKDLRNKIDGIALTVFMLSCKVKGPPISKKDRKDIWGFMGYQWTPENEQTLKDACMEQILSIQ